MGGVQQLQELIKDVDQQPEILVGDEGTVDVSHAICIIMVLCIGCSMLRFWAWCMLGLGD